MRYFIFVFAVWVLGVKLAMCQSELTGFRQYPQFRTASGLPGTGLPIDEEGFGGRMGPAAISIPVAYSLSRGHFVGGGSITASSLSPSGFTRSKATDYSNGSAWLMMGFSGDWGRATAGIMFLSGALDNVFNVTYQAPLKGPTSLGVGVQDVIGDGGASGDFVDALEDESSRSLFFVATHRLEEGLYFSGGIGTNRFRFGFAGVSWNMNSLLTATLEHDGFNFNGSLVFHPKSWRIGERTLQPALQVGTIRGKYLYLGLSFGL